MRHNPMRLYPMRLTQWDLPNETFPMSLTQWDLPIETYPIILNSMRLECLMQIVMEHSPFFSGYTGMYPFTICVANETIQVQKFQ